MIPLPAGFRHAVVVHLKAKRSHHLLRRFQRPLGCWPSEPLCGWRQVVGRPSASQQVVG